jgi:magnesium-transporting ATPase (P-type)
MANFRTLLINTLLIGLCVIAFLAFAFQISNDNDSPRNILSDPTLNKTYNNLNSSLNTYRTLGESQLNATTNEPPTTSFDSIILFSIVGAGRVFTSIITDVYDIFFTLLIETIGIPVIVITVFITIILITVIFLVWKTFRAGE